MVIISFYSYKGGVGRSLALANLAVYLAQFGAKVVMIDFDLEAPGLHYKLRPGADPISVPNRGLAGLLADASTGVPPDSLNYDLVLDVTSAATTSLTPESDVQQPQGRLLLLPAGNPLERQYWHDLAAIDWSGLFTAPPRAGVLALANLKRHLIERYEPDVVLIDSRTGITPSGGVVTTLLPDVVVLLLLNTREHIDGSRMVVSAIVDQDATLGARPRVVPVLSRYTSRGLRERLALEGRRRSASGLRAQAQLADPTDETPLEEMQVALVAGLSKDGLASVSPPLVLHADLDLQHHEQLWFGPEAARSSAGAAGALLDDYLRLFASVVPREMVERYLSGVRSQVRGIILDRPDDAVRTLENLVALVGDEEVFVDLVKVYVLRRDSRAMLSAAERLFRVHGRIVAIPAISAAMRDILVGRLRPDGEPISARFAEAYWRSVAPDDEEFGMGVARALANEGHPTHAQELAEQLLARSPNASTLAILVEGLAAGTSRAELIASTLALKYFDIGENSVAFVQAAAIACRYQPNPDLANKIVQSSEFSALDDTLVVDTLRAAGKQDEAGSLLVQVLSAADATEPAAEQYIESWIALSSRNPELRRELQNRNAAVLELLDMMKEGRRDRGSVRRPYR